MIKRFWMKRFCTLDSVHKYKQNSFCSNQFCWRLSKKKLFSTTVRPYKFAFGLENNSKKRKFKQNYYLPISGKSEKCWVCWQKKTRHILRKTFSVSKSERAWSNREVPFELDLGITHLCQYTLHSHSLNFHCHVFAWA